MVLKSAAAKGKLPGIVGLHNHAGNKYFGLHKSIRVSNDPHPAILHHQDLYYGGAAWANELARGGYVVVVHEAFTFGSRRMRLPDLPAVTHEGVEKHDPETQEEIDRHNLFTGEH